MLKIILISIPVLFILGSVLHFAYDYSKQNKIVGLFTPVNESVFEHSKLLLTPLLLFWLISIAFLKGDINYNIYFTSVLVSIVVSIITMISFYYTYSGVIGKNSEILNILDLLISIVVGQLVASHIYTYSNGFPLIVSIFLIIIILISFIYLTFSPLKIPLFYDQKSKTYGINEKSNS